jgi:murein DD-endopeptidase MepM/ murein hydrolase activator NlpD
MKLNTKQTQQVADFLRTYTQLSYATQEELLDHLCCEIEDAMRGGASFEEAFKAVQGRWNEDEVQKIHSSTQNKSFMIKIFLAASLAAILTLSPWLVADQFPSSGAAPLPETTTSALDPPNNCPLPVENCSLHHGFGPRWHPITKKKVLHRGIDYQAPMGTEVSAAGEGIVSEAGHKGAYGYCIVIQHDDTYQTLYAHLSRVDVAVGDEIKAGAPIGAVGSSGASTGPHLHFEILENGAPVDPELYIP